MNAMQLSRLDAEVKALFLAHEKPALYEHVTNVAAQSVLLAQRFGLDERRCRVAALLHDIAGIRKSSDMLNEARKAHMEIDPAEEKYPFLLHQRFSAMMAQERFGVTDERILSAIRCHSTLKAAPSQEDMLIFLADKIAWDQDGAPPFLGAIEAGLTHSLARAALAYMDYVVEHGMLLMPHRWFLAAHAWLRANVQAI